MFKRKIFGVSVGVSGCIAAGAGLKLFKIFSKPENEDETQKSKSDKRQILLDGYELKQVQIMIRHGARTPIHTMNNVEEVGYNNRMFLGDVPHTMYNHRVVNLDGDPRPPSTYDAYYSTADKLMKDGGTRGVLTKRGQEQMYLIGQMLRKQYITDAKFIVDVFNPSEVYVRSTNIGRTIATARCLVGGMFGYQKLNELSDPLQIHVDSSLEDVLLPRTGSCPVLRQINHYAMIHGGDLPELKEDRLLVEDLLGIEPDGIAGKHKVNFIDVRDDIVARETHGYSCPKMLEPHREMIENNANKVMYYAFCSHQESQREVAMRLSAGPLVKLITDNIENAEELRTKMYIYSCHDSTLVCLLGTFDVYDFVWPPFGAHVIVELYENKEKQKYVRVSYNGKDQIVRGCSSELCPLDEFKKGLSPYAIDKQDYDQLCSSNILELIAQEEVAQEKGEIEDTEDKERSDVPAGM